MRHALLTLAILLMPRLALACPVCFGQSDSPLASAMNAGIFMMLGVVGVVLASFATFFIYLVRRARAADRLVTSESERHLGPHPEEGTVRC